MQEDEIPIFDDGIQSAGGDLSDIIQNATDDQKIVANIETLMENSIANKFPFTKFGYDKNLDHYKNKTTRHLLSYSLKETPRKL